MTAEHTSSLRREALGKGTEWESIMYKAIGSRKGSERGQPSGQAVDESKKGDESKEARGDGRVLDFGRGI